jgi:molybdopterin-guanine dinucleotide biosynthesis protein A
MRGRRAPIGVVLAGGRGRRIGGSKATVELCGRPLIQYPLMALSGVLDEVAIVAKADTELPGMPGVTVWIEPPEPRHPLIGIVEALGLADGRSVLVCAGDMPFLSPALLRTLAAADPQGTPAVLAVCEGRLQPFPGLYLPRAAAPLRAAALSGDAKLTDAVAALGPRLLDVQERETFFNVNLPEDILHAAAILDRREVRAYPNVKS